MKESIVLLVLGACWAGYLGWYWRENRRTTNRRSNGIHAFSSGLGSLGGSAARTNVFRPGVSALSPRTVSAAARRRREVVLGLGALATLTLFAAMGMGGIAVYIHVIVDVALVAYGYALMQRRNDEAEREIKVHMLYPERAPQPVTAGRQAVSS
ncbi:MAG: hypothetical protein ACI9C1_002690 [Candidatus Aldehydirespiratoraceae bacterium]|jgi:hypothetical protein